MLSLSQAFKIIDDVVHKYDFGVENIATENGLGRILAQDQLSALDLPSFNRATMDGYAILADDQNKAYKIIDVIAAGKTSDKTLQPGTCVKVMTGAPVPKNAGKVVPVEMTVARDNQVEILQQPSIPNIAYQGEDVKTGDLILQRGNVLQPAGIANLIACGIAKIDVLKKPQVAIISTGDEIVDQVTKIAPGKIMNSNAPLLQTLCQQFNLHVIQSTAVSDNADATLAAIKQAATIADIILISGGVSAGDFDYVTNSLPAAGFKIHFNRLALKPGRPTTFASAKEKIVFALPGNPVAVFLTFHLFVLYALRRMCSVATTPMISLPLARDIKRKFTERAEFLPCKIQNDGTLLPIEFHGSGHLAALITCDGFCFIEQGIAKLSAKTCVNFMFTR